MGTRINKDLANRFAAVFDQKLWGEEGTISGPGSHKDNPMAISALSALETVIETYSIQSIADIPCGDFNFLSPLTRKYPNIKYVGYDIVQAIVEKNRCNHPSLRFDVFDIVSDIPPTSDLIFTKELLIHLNNDHVMAAIENMRKSGAKYLLASNSFGVQKNEELTNDTLGYARPIDLIKAPFNFPDPLWKNWFYALWDFRDLKIVASRIR